MYFIKIFIFSHMHILNKEKHHLLFVVDRQANPPYPSGRNRRSNPLPGWSAKALKLEPLHSLGTASAPMRLVAPVPHSLGTRLVAVHWRYASNSTGKFARPRDRCRSYALIPRTTLPVAFSSIRQRNSLERESSAVIHPVVGAAQT